MYLVLLLHSLLWQLVGLGRTCLGGGEGDELRKGRGLARKGKEREEEQLTASLQLERENGPEQQRAERRM